MNQPKSRRGARSGSADDHDDEVRRLWLVADPAPPEIAEAAKREFTRRRRARTVLPLVPDHHRPSSPFVTEPAGVVDRLHFGAGRSPVHLDIETVVKNRVVTLRCAVSARRMKPSEVVAESPGSVRPMKPLGPGLYGAAGLPAGPIRVAVDFAGRPGRSVVTTWFTA